MRPRIRKPGLPYETTADRPLPGHIERICPNCGKKFWADQPDGDHYHTIAVSCSSRCKKALANARNYQRRKQRQ